MLDPLALWKALRHFSLTFAVVFASTLLGVSVTTLLKKILGTLPLPWLVLWLAPMIVIALVARHEAQWLPDDAVRRRLARRIVLGAIGAWIALMILRAWLREDPPPSPDTAPRPTAPVRRGPPSK